MLPASDCATKGMGSRDEAGFVLELPAVDMLVFPATNEAYSHRRLPMR
jgi:hypothetical protein